MIFNLNAGEVKTLPIVSTKYPENITVKAGENAVFSAVIDKDGVPTEYTYKWYVDNSLVSDATTAVYVRKTDADKGVYSVYCVITNKAGSVKTRTATLTVNALPKLDSTKPEDTSANLDSSNILSVSISEHGYPESYTYQWYNNGTKISGATGSRYTFKPTSAGKTTFYCEVTNAAGTVKSRNVTITANNIYTLIPGNGINGKTTISGSFGGVEYIKVNVTSYNKMEITALLRMGLKGSFAIGLSSGVPNGYSKPDVGYYVPWTADELSVNKSYDISNVSGDMYFFVAGAAEDSGNTGGFSCSLSLVRFSTMG